MAKFLAKCEDNSKDFLDFVWRSEVLVNPGRLFHLVKITHWHDKHKCNTEEDKLTVLQRKYRNRLTGKIPLILK